MMPDEISATSSESETATLAVNKRIPSDGWTPRRVRLQAVISCVHSSSVHGAGLLTQRLAGPIQHVVSNASYPQSRQVGFTSESPVARLFTFSPSGWLRGEAEMAAASLVQPGTSLTRQSSRSHFNSFRSRPTHPSQLSGADPRPPAGSSQQHTKASF